MSVKLLTEHHFEFLSLKGGYTGLSESTIVKISHCWKSHVAAHIINDTYRPLNHEVSTKITDGSNIRRILLRSIRINSAYFLCVKTWKTLSNLIGGDHTECVIGPGSKHDIGCILRTVNCFSRHPLVGIERCVVLHNKVV